MEMFIVCANILLVVLILYTIYKTYFLKEGASGCDASAGENDAKNEADSLVASLNARITNMEVLLNMSKSIVEGQRSELDQLKADLEEQVSSNKEKMNSG